MYPYVLGDIGIISNEFPLFYQWNDLLIICPKATYKWTNSCVVFRVLTLPNHLHSSSDDSGQLNLQKTTFTLCCKKLTSFGAYLFKCTTFRPIISRSWSRFKIYAPKLVNFYNITISWSCKQYIPYPNFMLFYIRKKKMF